MRTRYRLNILKKDLSRTASVVRGSDREIYHRLRHLLKSHHPWHASCFPTPTLFVIEKSVRVCTNVTFWDEKFSFFVNKIGLRKYKSVVREETDWKKKETWKTTKRSPNPWIYFSFVRPPFLPGKRRRRFYRKKSLKIWAWSSDRNTSALTPMFKIRCLFFFFVDSPNHPPKFLSDLILWIIRLRFFFFLSSGLKTASSPPGYLNLWSLYETTTKKYGDWNRVTHNESRT